MPDQNQHTSYSAYTGRFAPSPSGPLHMGSLVTALASYLDAKSNQGRWLVRMEDLDPPRESPQAATQILSALESHGLQWDGEVLYQSQRSESYEAAIRLLAKGPGVYACQCSRQQISALGGRYPGTCREINLPWQVGYALRCKTCSDNLTFNDLLQGAQQENPAETTGDFIIKRKDGLYAYQLAVVVDDAFQKVSHIIRGIDLLDSTPRQLYLQHALGHPAPVYAHLPIITDHQGLKLSKQHGAQAINCKLASVNLVTALTYLQQETLSDLASGTVQEILDFATLHWDRNKLFGFKQIELFEASPDTGV